MKKGLLIFAFIGLTLGVLLATTWRTEKIKCQICNKKNKFQVISSYGNYIYDWPEKLEYIYWPTTETYSLYTCKKCNYSAFMWDFKKTFGKDTLEIIKNELPKLKLSASSYNDKMTTKLESAELIYQLYNDDPDFWCKFHRIKAYHYDAEGNTKAAETERLKALSIADSLAAIPSNVYRKKELLLITSSMKHFTQQDSAALVDIHMALSMFYMDTTMTSAGNSNFNAYLDEVLNELKQKVNNSK
ncbi:hypothetical protein OO013_16995 [Mangrovivirga sp. M17]|uniref:DUF2225 domain-containing protein n=1 Tax=Mangrovivirga halotolerans TaxID=2993936 RepID=A0ABT3RVL1_9BACT|nr:hypothetical protein [Mangrovivirga halotolerans]MCX2745581.1 hypothetical protein [Mangrovivirga halotolerans]